MSNAFVLGVAQPEENPRQQHATISIVNNWRLIPFQKRMFILTIIVFSIMLGCSGFLIYQSWEDYSQQKMKAPLSSTIKNINKVVWAIHDEKNAAMKIYEVSTDETNYMSFDRAIRRTNLAMSNVINSEWGLEGAQSITSLGIESLSLIRALIQNRAKPQSIQMVRDAYNQAMVLASNLQFKYTTRYVGQRDIIRHLQSILTLQIAENINTATDMATRLVEAQKKTIKDKETHDMMQFLQAEFLKYWFGSRLTMNILLNPIQHPDIISLNLAIAAAYTKHSFFDLQDALSATMERHTKGKFTTPQMNITDDISGKKAVEKLRDSMDDNTNSSPNSCSIRVIWNIFMGVICILILIYVVIRWTYYESVTAKENVSRIRNGKVMHDVAVRVNELVHSFATFSLSSSPVPVTMEGTAVGVLELRLQQCLASLKTIAPSLPPLLFPARLRALAGQVSIYKDRLNYRVSNEVTGMGRVNFLRPEDIKENKYKSDMREQTKDRVYFAKIAVMTVDMTAFAENGAQLKFEALDVTRGRIKASKRFKELTASCEEAEHDVESLHDIYTKVVTCIEECTYLYGGIMHSVGLDRVVCVWMDDGKLNNNNNNNNRGEKRNANTTSTFLHSDKTSKRVNKLTAFESVFGGESILDVPDSSSIRDCERMTACALSLSARLLCLCRRHSALQRIFYPKIGLSAGTVLCGIFGSPTMKVLQLFGGPLLQGLNIARCNDDMLTTVCCDEAVHRLIFRSRCCRPIEILEHGRIYEVIVNHHKKEVEMDVGLSAYRKGFDLYERKFYKEALRAFQSYTKQYGYDGCVERLQNNIIRLM